MVRRKKQKIDEMLKDENADWESDNVYYREKGGIVRGGVYDVDTGTVKDESDQEEVFDDLVDDEDAI